MSGQSFPQDVVAGTQLVVPSIHSPNYLTGVSGWTINLDGSAEFNNLTIRGTFSGTNFIINSSGAFFYSPTEALGNLIVSIASAAGTDSFGNSYPKGINVTTGTISGTTISGTTITGSTFDGTDFIIGTAGAFFYSGTPANGNLVASISPLPGTSSGTDSFGNTYYGGFTSYQGPNNSISQLANGDVNAGLPSAFAGTGGAGPGSLSCNATNGAISIFSGVTAAVDTQSIFFVESANNSGVSNGAIFLDTGQVFLGNSGAANWDDNGQQFNLTAGTGPFIQGQGFNTLSNAGGVSGLCRVKLVPWNMVFFDMRCTVTLSGSTQTLTFGSLPSASFLPATNNVQAPASIGGTPSSDINPRVQINTSGGVQVVIPAGSGTNVQLGAQFFYPTN